MAKFMLLGSGGTMPETEAEVAEVMKAWGAWYESLGSAVVDPGNPMSAAKRISSNGDVSDGSVAGMLNGYIILSADSLDQAVEMAQRCPILQGGSDLSVYEITEVM